VNLLVSTPRLSPNTGGQASKATPLGAVAKSPRRQGAPKKDCAMMAINYGNVYVAKIAFGANDMQTQKAFLEAEAFDGPSILICYSHCIAHGTT